MRSYLLVTDTCVYAINGKGAVLTKMAAKSPAAIFVSVITEAELRAGATKSASPIKAQRALEAFLSPLQIVDMTSADAISYAHVRAALEKKGPPIGPLDMLIAAQALARGHWIVTNNEREFRRVHNLHLENWAA